MYTCTAMLLYTRTIHLVARARLRAWSVMMSMMYMNYNYLAHEALLLRQPGGVPGVGGALLGALGPAEGDHIGRLRAEGARRLLTAVAG